MLPFVNAFTMMSSVALASRILSHQHHPTYVFRPKTHRRQPKNAPWRLPAGARARPGLAPPSQRPHGTWRCPGADPSVEFVQREAVLEEKRRKGQPLKVRSTSFSLLVFRSGGFIWVLDSTDSPQPRPSFPWPKRPALRFATPCRGVARGRGDASQHRRRTNRNLGGEVPLRPIRIRILYIKWNAGNSFQPHLYGWISLT